QCDRHRPALLSFPTRRSSDLVRRQAQAPIKPSRPSGRTAAFTLPLRRSVRSRNATCGLKMSGAVTGRARRGSLAETDALGVQLFKLARADAVPFAARAVKPSVVAEPAGLPDLVDRDACEEVVLPGDQPHLDDVLVIGNIHILLENVGNAVFVGEKCSGNRIERQVAGQVALD